MSTPHPTTSVDEGTSTSREKLLIGGSQNDLSIVVGEDDDLISSLCCVDSAKNQRQLVLAPVDMHKRNLQHRLPSASTDSISITDIAEVAEGVLSTGSNGAINLDRIDRLSALRKALESRDDVRQRIAAIPGVEASAESVEHLRSEVESVTNYHPTRVECWRDIATETPAPTSHDTTELLDISIEMQQALAASTSKAVSGVEVVRRATRAVMVHDVWGEVYPGVSRLVFVGMSSLSAPHIDFLHSIAEETAVEVEIHCRRGTGAYHIERVAPVVDVSSPGRVIPEVRG